MYFRGNGISKDFGAALKWYRAAAEHGNAEGPNPLLPSGSGGGSRRASRAVAIGHISDLAQVAEWISFALWSGLGLLFWLGRKRGAVSDRTSLGRI